MDIIIMGLGAVGLELTEALSAKPNINVTVIDTNEDKVAKAVEDFDVIGVTGNGITYDTLKEANVSKTELLIATTSQDELNILCCVMGKKFGAKTTIARISETDYFKLIDGDNGLDINLMVNPQHEAAKEIRRILRFPSAIHVDKFSDGKVELVEFKVPEDSVLAGLILKEIPYRFKNRVLVCAATRGDDAIIPSGNFVINPGDHIFVTGTKLEITGFFKEIGLHKQAKNVLIVGGSKTSCYLAEELHNNNIHATIIEKDSKKCQKLASLFPFANIIHGDGTNQQLLREEGISDEEVMEACRYVNADSFINKLEAGLDDVVQERGNNFSAGQRQLLSFARTIIHKPAVMILDEATANIDTETEQLIQNSLEKMMNIGTMLIVAHRLSTVQHADNIIVLSHGQIVEQGNHFDLLKQKGNYYNLYTLQNKKSDLLKTQAAV